MTTDPIIDEIHAIREEIARRYNYDLEAIAEAMRKASAMSGRRVVTLPPRAVSAPGGARQTS